MRKNKKVALISLGLISFLFAFILGQTVSTVIAQVVDKPTFIPQPDRETRRHGPDLIMNGTYQVIRTEKDMTWIHVHLDLDRDDHAVHYGWDGDKKVKTAKLKSVMVKCRLKEVQVKTVLKEPVDFLPGLDK